MTKGKNYVSYVTIPMKVGTSSVKNKYVISYVRINSKIHTRRY